MKKDSDSSFSTKKISALLATPFVFIVPPLVGYFLGKWLDGYFHTRLSLSYLLLGLGFLAGFVEFYRIVKKLYHEDHD